MTPAEVAKLERKLGYQFENPELLSHAMTHRSYAAKNNERLEFLGDGILNFVIAEALYHQFDQAAEGQLSRLRASLVKQKTLADIAREMNLSDFLIMGTGELKSGGFNRDSILSDALEAIVAAIYSEAGFDTTKKLVVAWFASRLGELSLDQVLKDPKSRLQEWLQAKKKDLPNYSVVAIGGEAHQQKFTVRLRLPMLKEAIETSGSSRRAAEQSAAEQALKMLEKVAVVSDQNAPPKNEAEQESLK